MHKYPALVKEMNLKIRQEELDQDYISKLNDAEKAWLNQFNKEYVCSDFRTEDKDGKKIKRIHPKKFITKKVKSTGKKKKVDVYKKECGDRNNSRNRDSLGITKINNMLKGEDSFINADLINRSTNYEQTEDALIAYIDQKKEILK